MSIRPLKDTDPAQLDLFRENYWHANLEIPYGYTVPGSVETAVAEKDGEIIGGLTATKVVVYDFMKNPTASPTDIFSAVFMLERTLSYVAQSTGVTTSYIAIPEHLTDYIESVKRCGYDVGFEKCTILRRSLRKELPSLGDARDAAISK